MLCSSVVAVLVGVVGVGSLAPIAATASLSGGVAVASEGGWPALRINVNHVSPGQDVRVRVENRGSQGLYWSYQYELSHLVGKRWLRVDTHPMYSPRFFLEPGAAGPWQRIGIGADVINGVYKVVKSVEPVQGRERRLEVKFRVRESA